MIRTRIAPSPTGYPHIGTLYQILLDYSYAKKHNGKFFIRIEDTDRSRFVEDAEEKLYEALDWLGLSEDESPRKGGDFGPYKQSERLNLYHKYVQELIDNDHAYSCFCTSERLEEMRKEMQLQGKVPMYDGHCRNIDPKEAAKRVAAGEKYVVRLKVPRDRIIKIVDECRGEISFSSNTVDDQVLLKSDGFPTYHLAVVVDDHLMETTHVVRGEEWLPSAPKHVLLYEFFGWQMPKFTHTPTLRNPDKTKLSKRKGHTNLAWYKEQGFLPEAICNFLSQLGWTHPDGREIFDKQEFIRVFDFKDLSPAGPVFDETKLKWMNGKYIREHVTEAELAKALLKYWSEFPVATFIPNEETLIKVIPLIKERLETLADAAGLLTFLDPNLVIDQNLVKAQNKQGDEGTKALLGKLKAGLETLPTWETKEIEELVRTIKGDFESWKNKEFFMTIRVATTGFPVTPPLFESIEVLGRDIVMKRLEIGL